MRLVLSLFPGVDLFGRAFEKEGFCVVRGPDIIYGQDVRDFKIPRGRFDVIIGGPPCKSFSSASRGSSNSENLIPEFERLVSEGKPPCFVMENVPEAPRPKITGYAIQDYLLNSHDYGSRQRRERRFSFGYREDGFRSFPFVPEDPIPLEQRHKDPFPPVLACEGKYPCNYAAGHKVGRMLTLSEVCELQGIPELSNAWCFRPRGKNGRKVYRKEFEYELVGNGVEMLTGRVVARAVKRGLELL